MIVKLCGSRQRRRRTTEVAGAREETEVAGDEGDGCFGRLVCLHLAQSRTTQSMLGGAQVKPGVATDLMYSGKSRISSSVGRNTGIFPAIAIVKLRPLPSTDFTNTQSPPRRHTTLRIDNFGVIIL